MKLNAPDLLTAQDVARLLQMDSADVPRQLGHLACARLPSGELRWQASKILAALRPAEAQPQTQAGAAP